MVSVVLKGIFLSFPLRHVAFGIFPEQGSNLLVSGLDCFSRAPTLLRPH